MREYKTLTWQQATFSIISALIIVLLFYKRNSSSSWETTPLRVVVSLRYSRVLPTCRVFRSGYITWKSVLYFLNIIPLQGSVIYPWRLFVLVVWWWTLECTPWGKSTCSKVRLDLRLVPIELMRKWRLLISINLISLTKQIEPHREKQPSFRAFGQTREMADIKKN